MAFLETVERARAVLERNQRVSVAALRREFDLDDRTLEELVDELVDVQQVAAREGKTLAWIGLGVAARIEPRQTPASTGAERRQLTVMFCDLVRYSNLAEGLDAEDLRDVMRTYHEAATQAIARYDGHVAQYLGDGLLVYFGYPQAHEDDGERAVRAGLEILVSIAGLNESLHSRHGVRLAARIGVHTGAVVVGELGRGPSREQHALGATTVIASRLQECAEPGTLVISGATLKLVPRLFRTADLGTPTLKGIQEPISAYAVLGENPIRGRLDVDPRRLTPFVGREHEVALLLERWERVRAGEGKAVLISGDAGVGKSRLLRAFGERLAGVPHSWFECQCYRYKRGAAFHPLVALIEQLVGFEASDPPEEKLRRLEGALQRPGLSRADAVPLISSVLSMRLPDGYPPLQYSPELQRRKTIEALGALVLARARNQPLVMVVEDLHWCDPSTLGFLSWLLDQSPRANVMALLSFRPDFEPTWAPLSHVTHLEVGRLVPAEAESLVGGVIRDAALSEDVLRRIVERADGVPLFLEELTKMLVEAGLEDAQTRAIPATLQDLLMARLDRLGVGKEVAQLGAVLGREFSYALLRAVSNANDADLSGGIEALLDAELLLATGEPPDATYTFTHALIQDTAYQSLLRSARRRLHAETAQVLEEQFPERASLEPEVVARHYDEAGIAERAIHSYQRAARRATRQSASEEAIAALGRALELVEQLPESPDRKQLELDLQIAIGEPLYTTRGWANAEYGQRLQRARELALEIGKEGELFNVWTGLYLHHQVAGELPSAEDSARRALEVAGTSQDPRLTLFARAGLSQTLYLQGEFALALEPLEQLIVDWEDQPGRHLHLPNHVRALCLWALGYPDRALSICDATLASAEHVALPFDLASAYIYSGWILQKRGERTRALGRAQEAVDLCERFDLSWLPWATALRGSVSGQGELAVRDIERGIASLEASGTRGWVPHCYGALAEGLLRLDRVDDALRAVDAVRTTPVSATRRGSCCDSGVRSCGVGKATPRPPSPSSRRRWKPRSGSRPDRWSCAPPRVWPGCGKRGAGRRMPSRCSSPSTRGSRRDSRRRTGSTRGRSSASCRRSRAEAEEDDRPARGPIRRRRRRWRPRRRRRGVVAGAARRPGGGRRTRELPAREGLR